MNFLKILIDFTIQTIKWTELFHLAITFSTLLNYLNQVLLIVPFVV